METPLFRLFKTVQERDLLLNLENKYDYPEDDFEISGYSTIRGGIPGQELRTPSYKEKMKLMPKVMVIDDDRTIRELIRHSLEQKEIKVLSSDSPNESLSLVQEEKPDIILLDIMLPGISGLKLFEKIRRIDQRLPVIFITSSNDSDLAIKAMQIGAFDYFAKPLDLPALNLLLDKALETRRLMNVPVALSYESNKAVNGEQFVGRSPEMLEVFKSIGRVAAENISVLVQGESGTGKELVARAIYHHSPRKNECFMAVNCAALTENLLESELFGHEKGAFTGADKRRIGKFEQCNKGTIFLDEIGDMSLLTQGKVLRLLQDQTFERVGGNETIHTDVRIISATNKNLEQMVKDNEFREDLYYRLNGLTITLPPLRERGDDIKLLVEYYLSQACKKLERDDIQGISSEALELMTSYSWPGNVRELQSVIQRALLKETSQIIVPTSLPVELQDNNNTDLSVNSNHTEDSNNSYSSNNHINLESDFHHFIEDRLKNKSTNLYDETLEMMERYLLTKVLDETGGNQSKAAKILGITRGKIRDRISQFDIKVEKTVNIDKKMK